MARRIRFIPPGALVEVTCRTVQGRLLLRPSPLLREVVLGVLGRAQRLYNVELHAFVFLSNHFHLLVTATNALQLARFMGFVNSNVAREAGRLHGWREKFWGRRYQAIVVSDEERAQVERLRYVIAHGVKEGLVGSPLEWPGAHTVRALLHGEPLEGRWFDRTAEYEFRRRGRVPGPRDFATTEIVKLSPLPCWKGLAEEVRRRMVKCLVRSVEEEAVAERKQLLEAPLGSARVQGQHPHTQPQRSKKSPAPLIHAATRAVRRAFRDAYHSFVVAYRQASTQLLGGDRGAIFPVGSFPPALAWVGGLAPPQIPFFSSSSAQRA